MARFKDLTKQRPPRHVFDLAMPDGSVVPVAVRTLLNTDDDAIDTAAVEYARSRKAESAREGDPIYDRGRTLYTLLLACSDPDSPDEEPVPFFSSVDEIRTGLDRDRLAYLLAAQQWWQDQHSGRARSLKPYEALQKAAEIATSSDPRPFLELSPGLLWSVLRALGGYVLAHAQAEATAPSAEGAPAPPAGSA
jgi:hypothetical protein